MNSGYMTNKTDDLQLINAIPILKRLDLGENFLL